MNKQIESKNKGKYKILNWKEYNVSLKHRGSITFWFSEELIESWFYEGHRERGGKILYSDLAVFLCLTLKQVFHLKLRQTEGLVESLFEIMRIDMPVPDYSTLCRRSASLKIDLCPLRERDSLNIIVDSTGLKVYGEGEWKVRKHGWSKHRTWRKLHIGIDGYSFEIITAELTENSVSDGDVAEALINGTEDKIHSFTGDGAYDKTNVRKILKQRGIKQIIPPQENAVESKNPFLSERNKAINQIKVMGREKWKEKIKYHRRSLVETAMYRYKTICGDKINARKFENEITEIMLNCSILNAMTFLGMPKSIKVA